MKLSSRARWADRHLQPGIACGDALRWIRETGTRNIAELWEICERPDWMLWALARHPDRESIRYREAIVQFAREMAFRAAMHWAAAAEVAVFAAAARTAEWAAAARTAAAADAAAARTAADAARTAEWAVEREARTAEWAADAAAASAASAAEWAVEREAWAADAMAMAMARATAAEHRANADRIRELVGNPWRRQ